MSLSDFDTTELTESALTGSKEALTKKKKSKKKKKGCCINCWKMCSHTKVVPQKKLYNYLAERSSVYSVSDLMMSGKENEGKTNPSDNSNNQSNNSGMIRPSPFSYDNSAEFVGPISNEYLSNSNWIYFRLK